MLLQNISSAFSVTSPSVSTNNILPVQPVGFVDVAIGFDRGLFSIDSRSSPPTMVRIISFLFLLSPPFSTNLCHFRRSHDIFVVDRYSNFAISLTITNEVGELDGDVGIDAINIVGVDDIVGTVDIVGVPILKNAIGDVAIPHIGIGDVTVINRGITLTWRSPEVEQGRLLASNAYISCQFCATKITTIRVL